MAESWSRPPWEILGSNDKVIWMFRYREYSRARAEIEKEMMEKHG